jgi:hypothetical protein
MAVLPPVIVPCVEPNHSLTTTAVEPSHVFTPAETEPSHGFDACEDLVLMINGVVTMTIPLSWILYNSPITPASYNLYRKKNTDVYFRLIVTGINANTYNDSATQSNTTYDYYVRPVFPSGIEGIKSNIVSATTPALQYVYTLRGALDIYDVSGSPVLAASIANGLGGFSPYDQYADKDYLWINDGSSLYTFRWSTTPLNPTLVNSIVPVFPYSPQGGCQSFLIRRGLSDRNNLLILYNPGNTYFGALESYDITDPTNPVFISASALPDLVSPRGFAYDSTSHKIFNVSYNNYDHAYLYSWDVASNGTLGAATLLGANLDVLGRSWALGWMYAGYYWSAWPPTGNVAAFRLDGGGFAPGLGGPLPGPGVSGWAGCQPRVRGNYLFLGNSQTDPSNQAVCIIDMSTWTVIAQIGGLNHICRSLIVSGNTLIFATQTDFNFYVYDIAALLASGGAPVQTSVLQELNGDNGFAACPTDGWEGNNCGCAT